MRHQSKYMKGFKPFSHFNSKRMLIWGGAFAVIGVTSLFLVHAATSTSSIEPESGNRTANALIGNDPNASGGSFVQFTQGSTSGSGCGLTGEVFCENFDSGATTSNGRSGDLNAAKFSGERQQGTSDSGSAVNWVRFASIPACRNGSVTNPLPPNDFLICDPVATRSTYHALLTGTMQNYADEVVRVNQPFDFGGRTGTIRSDISLDGGNGNGSPEILISDIPNATASIQDENGHGTALQNGFIVQFRLSNSGVNGPLVRAYNNWAESELGDSTFGTNFSDSRNMVNTSPGKMNRLEFRLSQAKFEIWGTDFSNDGVNFGALRKLYSSVPISLPYSRAWYSFGEHNHATVKYENRISQYNYFDNIAFDGPALAAPNVYQIADNNQLHTECNPNANNVCQNTPGMNLGWQFKNRNETLMTPLTFSNVSTAGATKVQLVFDCYIDAFSNDLATRMTFYRLNGGAWHQYPAPPGIVANKANFAHRTMFVLDVSQSELVSGNNTVQFSGDNVWNGAATYVSNVDLLVWK